MAARKNRESEWSLRGGKVGVGPTRIQAEYLGRMVSNRSAPRAASVGILLPALLAAASFGSPALVAQADSAGRDSTRMVRLAPLSVTVTRTVQTTAPVPASVRV